MKTIYLDNNATTAVAPEVREAMLPYLTDLYGNPSSMHTFGGQVGRAVEEARERMAALLGAHPDEIIFTSCGSESDNAAIWSALQTQPEKRHLITTRVEHPAILNVAQYWERQGYRVTLLGVDNKGRLDLDEYAAALSDDTALVSIMYANNEVGNVFPISRMAEMAAEKGVLFHTDAVQAVGKEAIDLGKQPISMLSLSGHKLHAPKGIACSMCARVCASVPSCAAGTRNAAAVPVPRTCPTSSVWAWPPSWPGSTCRKNAPRWPACATSWNRACWPPSLTAWSTAIPRTACPTPPTSRSRTWKAKPSC